MNEWKTFFKDKKITVMGAGLLGGIGDIRFLAEQGADLIVTDLKLAEGLQSSLDQLNDFPIKFTLGKHELADFRDRDLIIKSPTTPIDSPFIAEAKKHKIPVTMWAALFARFAREAGVPIVGITGTRGKTTTTALIAAIFEAAGKSVITGGNVQGVSIVSQLPNLNRDSVAVLELDSWKLQGFAEEKISPEIAVFTTFYPDHLNYYNGDLNQYLADKATIFLNQTPEDTLVVGEQVAPLLQEKYGKKIQSHVVVAKTNAILKSWKLRIPGEHNRYNAACALAAARAFGIDEEIIKTAIESFGGVPGRLEFVREIDGVKIYNDTTATTPEATLAAISAVSDLEKKNIILIMGGADKGLDMSGLLEEVQARCKRVILLSGSGTEKIKAAFPDSPIFNGLPPAIAAARESATSGDVILFSPAFASFGMFKNEYDRGDQFMKLVSDI